MNPCPCGFLGHPRKPCKCTEYQIRNYQGRIGGPLLDRIDLHVEVPAIAVGEVLRVVGSGVCREREETGSSDSSRDLAHDLSNDLSRVDRLAVDGSAPTPDTSADVQRRVENARDRQRLRFASLPGVYCNAHMGLGEIDVHCRCPARVRGFLERAAEALCLSARAVHRSLRVARTIADLEGRDEITREDVGEAMQYRGLDRGGV